MLGEQGVKGAGEAAASATTGLSPMTELDTFRDEFVQVSRDMSRVMRGVLEPICVGHALSQQQALLLLSLWANPGASMGQACEDLGILRTNFTSLAHKMEDRDLVKRTQDARDKRSFTLDLTERGRALVASMQEEFAQRNAHITAALSSQVQEDLQRGLRAVKAIIEAMKDANALERHQSRRF